MTVFELIVPPEKYAADRRAGEAIHMLLHKTHLEWKSNVFLSDRRTPPSKPPKAEKGVNGYPTLLFAKDKETMVKAFKIHSDKSLGGFTSPQIYMCHGRYGTNSPATPSFNKFKTFVNSGSQGVSAEEQKKLMERGYFVLVYPDNLFPFWDGYEFLVGRSLALHLITSAMN